MITTPDFYELTAEEYHADPCPFPSLSHSVAREMLRSPMHGKYAHSRLTPRAEDEATDAMDMGSIVHGMLLGKGGAFTVLDFPDWRTKAAKEAREATREAGNVPILRHKYAEAQDCYKAALQQMQDHPALQGFFASGVSEAVAVWREGDAWCRGMIDRLPDNGCLFDIKTTGLSADPVEWQRKLIRDYATQDAFYARAVKALRGYTPPPMRFVVIETSAPYAISVMECAPSLREYAMRRVEKAVNLWQNCMATNVWPGYTNGVASVDAPSWLIDQMILDEG